MFSSVFIRSYPWFNSVAVQVWVLLVVRLHVRGAQRRQRIDPIHGSYAKSQSCVTPLGDGAINAAQNLIRLEPWNAEIWQN